MVQVVGPVRNDDLPARFSTGRRVGAPEALGSWCPDVVAEALACGLPVVCGSWGGTAELVGEGGRRGRFQLDEWTYGEDYIDAARTQASKLCSTTSLLSNSKHANTLNMRLILGSSRVPTLNS